MVLRDYLDEEWLQIHIDYGSCYLLLIVLTLCTALLLRHLSRPKLKLPPGPTGLPLVGYLPFLGKEPFKALDKLTKKYGNVYRKQVDLHRQSRSGAKGKDFISTYVEAMKTKKSEGSETFFNERNLIGNTQSLYIAGTDTAKTSLIWLFLVMAAYPDIQDKVHGELDSVLRKNERATWEDRQKCPYIYATIMECQRWKIVVPLNTSRVAMEDTTICGYDIPKGSTIIANNWSLHNDIRYWSEPEKFNPDRFLKNDRKEVILKQESYLPFSSGKRKCPGETVALMEIFLYFTAIMQTFDVKAPKGRQPNFDAMTGLTYQPVPQELCFLPRQKVYEAM